MGRDRYPKQSLGALHGRIKQVCLLPSTPNRRILMVGAGGIGCELLKNLVLTGFGEVHIVDLDTIDLSNLNRQFLFRHEHIKKSKALVCSFPVATVHMSPILSCHDCQVAKESAAKFNPHIRLEAHHANIKDPQFNMQWFQTFNLVFNALDNLDARRHVNKMCLAADVPLIESGTTGFNGQGDQKGAYWLHSAKHTAADTRRVKPSAMTATRKKCQRAFPFAPFEVPQVNRYIA